MNNPNFRRNVQTAISAGSRARANLAKDQADKFLKGSADFNPQSLQKLGTAGLKYFLTSIEHSELVAEPKGILTETQLEVPQVHHSKSLSWANMRRSEPMWKIRAILFGTGTGLTLLAIGTTVLNISIFGGQ